MMYGGIKMSEVYKRTIIIVSAYITALLVFGGAIIGILYYINGFNVFNSDVATECPLYEQKRLYLQEKYNLDFDTVYSMNMDDYQYRVKGYELYVDVYGDNANYSDNYDEQVRIYNNRAEIERITFNQHEVITDSSDSDHFIVLFLGELNASLFDSAVFSINSRVEYYQVADLENRTINSSDLVYAIHQKDSNLVLNRMR